MIDIRLDNFYEQRLAELQAHYREPTATAVVRMLIRNASQEAGLWPGPREGEEAVRDLAVYTTELRERG